MTRFITNEIFNAKEMIAVDIIAKMLAFLDSLDMSSFRRVEVESLTPKPREETATEVSSGSIPGGTGICDGNQVGGTFRRGKVEEWE